MRSLYLDWNRLNSLPIDIFQGNTQLEQLYLDGNNINELSPATIRGLTVLHSLTIAANDLFDLDIAALVNELPSLKVFGFDENLFECNRLADAFVDVENILLVRAQRKKYRSFSVSRATASNYSCLNVAIWTAQYNRAAIEKQTETLRKLLQSSSRK